MGQDGRMTDASDGTPLEMYRHLPPVITLAETSTMHDTSGAAALGSLGSISAQAPGLPVGPEGAGGGDGD